MAVDPGSESELPSGTLVNNRYLIQGGPLGRGGNGITYRAQDQSLDRVVALKELFATALVRRDGPVVSVHTSSERDNYEKFLARFQDEARRLAKVRHSNVVQVYDQFRANGTGYMVMDLVEGQTVGKRVQTKGACADEERVRAILTPLLGALEAVHEQGLIHRDLNPNNIILRARDDQPILLDFGTARPAGQLASTAAVQVYPGYAPIEQYRPHDALQPCADIYGLAAIAWLLVTGKDPFDAPTRVSDDFDPLGKARDKARGRPFSPGFLDAIDWGLERFSKKRPQTIAAWRPGLAAARAAPRPDPRPESTPVVVLAGRWPEPGCVFRDRVAGGTADPALPEMVVIPPGRFVMGSPPTEPGRDDDEGPQHPVTIARPFALGRTAVTRGQFRCFVEATGHRLEGGAYGWDGKSWTADPNRNWLSPGFVQTDDHPVVCVNWNDARAYVAWLSSRTGAAYRLPSEAEWEYACRAGTTTARYWGDGIEEMVRYAQCGNETTREQVPGAQSWAVAPGKTGYAYTAPVGRFLPNGFGLFDTLGNVWEWCEDGWHGDYNGAPNDGSVWINGSDNLRVLRGGSWIYYPSYVRSAYRCWSVVGNRINYIGFRLARTVF